MTNIRPINGFDFKAEPTPVEPEPRDVIADLQLELANGATLEEVLTTYRLMLAVKLQERADAFVNREDPLVNALTSGLTLAADQVRVGVLD